MSWFAGAGARSAAFIFFASGLFAAGPALAQSGSGAEPPLRGSVGPEDPRAYRSPAGSSIPAYGYSRPPQREPLYDSEALAPNYGRPRPKSDRRARYSGQRPVAGRKLPAPEPYATAPAGVRARQAQGPDAAPPPTYAATPAPARRPRPRSEEEPYEPLGLRLGSVLVKPYVDVQGGYDSNPQRTAGGGGSPALRGGLGFTAASDWSRHEFTAEASASALSFTKVPDASRPAAEGKANLRLDISRDTFANVELRGALGTQRSDSPEVPGAALNQPTVASFGATTGVTQRFGRLETGVSLLADRRVYGDAELAGGGVSQLSKENYSEYGLRARLAYEVTPGVKPFIEAGGDRRLRDEAVDASGYERESAGVLARAGSTFELTRTLTGEASAGYARRAYADNRLPILAGPTLDGKLIWSATPLTTVTARAATELNETNVAGASGSINHVVSLDVAHALLRNVTLGAGLALTDTQYRGAPITERTWAGALRAEYAFNRYLRARGSYAYEKLHSTQPGGSYDAHIFLLGMRLTP